jgi:hypothetical protein
MSGGKIKNGVVAVVTSTLAAAAHGALSAPVVLQNFGNTLQTGTVSLGTLTDQFVPEDLTFGSAGYALGGTPITGGTWAQSMGVFSDTKASVQDAVGTGWGFTAQNTTQTTSGKLRISGNATWNLGSSGGTLSGGAKGGLLYNADDFAYLPLEQFNGVELQGSGSSQVDVLFTLVLAQPTLFGQASAFTQVLVPAGQPMGNVRLDFSNLVHAPDANGNKLTLSTVMFLGIDVTYLFSVAENDPTLGSASGNYDISQVVLVPGPGAAAILAAWGLATARRRTR